MIVAVTGGSGFIGTNLTAALADAGHTVRILDGETFKITLDNPTDNRLLIYGADAVVHLAANADVRSGWDDPTRDLRNNTELTCALLAAMKSTGVRRLVFASTGSVYHPGAVNHYHDESCVLRATSLYAASKAASEQFIQAYAAAGHIDPVIVRLVSVLGPHYSHGHVIDFVHKLLAEPLEMDILGTGFQHKGYVHVDDVVSAILRIVAMGASGVFNVGTPTYATPMECAVWVAQALDVPTPALHPTMESWPGDNPNILLDCTKLRTLGWRPQHTIEDSIKETARWLM